MDTGRKNKSSGVAEWSKLEGLTIRPSEFGLDPKR